MRGWPYMTTGWRTASPLETGTVGAIAKSAFRRQFNISFWRKSASRGAISPEPRTAEHHFAEFWSAFPNQVEERGAKAAFGAWSARAKPRPASSLLAHGDMPSRFEGAVHDVGAEVVFKITESPAYLPASGFQRVLKRVVVERNTVHGRRRLEDESARDRPSRALFSLRARALRGKAIAFVRVRISSGFGLFLLRQDAVGACFVLTR